jgi:plasmid stabilization system protein ParE
MSWRIVVRCEIEDDLTAAADWYDSNEDGLGDRFIDEVFQVFDALEKNPLLRSRSHPRKNIRWRYPQHFPYHVIYEVNEQDSSVIIAAVPHAARHDRHWKRRV